MKIADLIRKLDYHFNDIKGEAVTDPDLTRALLQTEVKGIYNDSRLVEEGGLFFCIKGENVNGHKYIPQVLEKGARALVVQEDQDITPYVKGEAPVVIRVYDTRYAMAWISAAWYGNPASRMKIIGITGTKGKTTTTYMVRSILQNAGYKVGLVGTIETLYGDVRIPSPTTTPESMTLQKYFRDMADAGMEAVVMEVSSQALMMHRTQGFIFDYGIFTNLSPDHIGHGEHRDFDHYLECKSMLFKQCRVGIVNGDDPYTDRILDGHTCSVETYGLKETNDLYAEDLDLIKKPGELGIRFHVKGLLDFDAEVPMPGRFSVYNALCAIAICRHFNADTEAIRKALLGIRVRGRIEMVKVSDRFTLLIDYAHNALSLRSLLNSLRDYEPHRLVTLFGCGGDRDPERRFLMGEESGRTSDFTIITSDNPRTEDPMKIIEDIETGMKRTDGAYITIPDRKEAIAYAIHNGQDGDIIVLAGKGHEDYQIIGTTKHHMDERELIRDILEEDARKA